MFADLSINLAASAIYDFGRFIRNTAEKTEAVQLARKKLGATQHLHDFPDRYLEALVELRFEQKSRVVLDLFRSKDIMQTFYGFYYGAPDIRNNETAHAAALQRHIESLKVGDDVKANNVDVAAEVAYFWQVFRQKVQESRTVKEVEVEQRLDELKRSVNDIQSLFLAFQDWVRTQGKSDIQIADKIYNIDKIDNAFFSTLINKPPRLLTTPPFNSEIFLGRENDLAAIETDYQQHNRLLVLVNGEGGIGKTTLAAKYWYAHEARYKHLAWLYADMGIGTALVTLKEKLDVAFAPDDDLNAQALRMAEALSNLDAPCLLIFDNANDDADLKKHYTLLNRLRNCHILLTSRVRKLADMKVHEVKPLALEEALELFKTHYTDLADDELPLLHDVLSAVGRNTLVTEVLAKNLVAFNRFARRYTLADLLHDLQSKGLLALKNKAVAVVYGSDTLREAKPTDIIAAMYDLAGLSETECRLLSNLAALPAENIPYALLATLLGAEDEEALETPLGSLETKGWIEYRKSDNSFKISPVVQEVTKSKNAGRLLDDCRSLVNTLLTGLDEDNRPAGNYQQAAVFARLGEAVVQTLPIDDDVAILCQNIGQYHKDTGNLSGMMLYYQKMRDILTALCETEPDNANFKNGLAISYAKLGNTQTALGNLDRALTFFQEYNQLENELYDAYPQNVAVKNSLAISYQYLGNTHKALGNLDRALAFFQDFNQLTKELCDAYPQNVSFKNGLAISYSKLGNTHKALGNLDKALAFFQDFNQLTKELCDAYPQNVSFKNGLAISYQFLGITHTVLGNLDRALTFFQDYNQLEKELYDAYPQNVSFKNGLAGSYGQLGSFYRDQKSDNKQARAYFEKCRALWQELSRDFPAYVEFQRNLAWAEEALKGLGD
ncbi:MAG: NB-ARC domain-containing protein [Saprospiraceae bacterium]|nr:NB-ARC domain-containing protein [Saprospiraceae bacterium]